MKAIVDKETCIGCGVCAQVAPDVYEMQGEKAVVLGEAVPDGQEDTAKEGAEQCPVDAISISQHVKTIFTQGLMTIYAQAPLEKQRGLCINIDSNIPSI